MIKELRYLVEILVCTTPDLKIKKRAGLYRLKHRAFYTQKIPKPLPINELDERDLTQEALFELLNRIK